MSDLNLNSGSDKHVELMKSIVETNKDAVADKVIENENIADTIADLMQSELTDEASASGIMVKTQKLQKRGDVKVEKNKESPESRLVRKEDADQSADQFANRDDNKQYHLDPLILSQLVLEELGLGINEKSDPADIVEIIRRRMSGKGEVINAGMIDKGLEFLLDITKQQIATANPVIKERLSLIYNRIETARLKYVEEHKEEIKICSNIIGAVDAVIGTTGEGVHEKLEEYRNFVHNPPGIYELLHQYEKEHKSYTHIVKEFKSLSHYIGSNLKRDSLENAELGRLAQAARKMQAILGTYKAAKEQSTRFMPGYFNNNQLFDH